MNKREKTIQLAPINLELSPHSQNIPMLPTREEASTPFQPSLPRNSKENIIPSSSQTSRGKGKTYAEQSISSSQSTTESQLKPVKLDGSPSKPTKELYIELPRLKHLQSPNKLYKNYISKSASITNSLSPSKGAKGVAAAYNRLLPLKTTSSRIAHTYKNNNSVLAGTSAQPQPNFVLSKQSTYKSRDSTPDELLLHHGLPSNPTIAVDDLQPDAPGLVYREQAPNPPLCPAPQSTEGITGSRSSLPTDTIEPGQDTAIKHNLPEDNLEASLKEGEETFAGHDFPKMVFLPRPKGHTTARWRLRMAKRLDRVPSPMTSRKQALSDALLMDLRTPRQRYCSLLEQLYGSGDIRRGDGRKPTKTKNEAATPTVPDDTELAEDASQSPARRSFHVAQNVPRSALAFVPTQSDHPSDYASDISEPELEAETSVHDSADVVSHPEELHMDVDVPFILPDTAKTSKMDFIDSLSKQDLSDLRDSTGEETLVDEHARKVKSHDPEDWKKDLRDLAVGKHTVNPTGILNINTALHSLEEMMQASSGQGLVLSLISDLSECLMQIRDLPDGLIPFNDSFRIRVRANALLIQAFEPISYDFESHS